MNEDAEIRDSEDKIPIKDFGAREKFRNLSLSSGYNPDDRWIGGYVDYEWGKVRHILDLLVKEKHQTILEFGCNIGATAVVTALLGHSVEAVDIDKFNADMAKLNALQYGVADRVNCHLVKDGERLDFNDGYFDVIICNSVLEYVEYDNFSTVMKELDRLLKPGGLLIITGTSNRLSPKEVHRGRWFINYLPTNLGKIIWGKGRYQRGVNPFRVMHALKHYVNLDLQDNGKLYFEIKKRFGLSAKAMAILKLLKKIFHPLGISVGLLTPSFSVNLRKPQ